MPKTAITGSLVSLEIDKGSKEPIHRQIADRLREAIQNGRMPAGTKLPSTRVFADELGVSRNTVMQVFEVLSAEGFLAGRVGAGTYVAGLPSDEAHDVSTEQPAPRNGMPYPFRSLSRRGKNLVLSATGEFSERPTPFMPDLPDLREFPIRTWLRLLNETSGRLDGRNSRRYLECRLRATAPRDRPISQRLARHGLRLPPGDHHHRLAAEPRPWSAACCSILETRSGWRSPAMSERGRCISANGAAPCILVPVDEDGICAEIAALTLPVPRFVFTSPSGHYPLGATLSMARRHALLRFAQASGSWIVEDDYDHEFRYVGTSVAGDLRPRYRCPRTIHIGTFSKILLLSFRLGYVVAPADLADAFATARAVVDRHASLIEQMVLVGIHAARPFRRPHATHAWTLPHAATATDRSE